MIAKRFTPRGVHAVELTVAAGGYYLAALVGLSLAIVGDSVTPLWPPTGVAVVAFMAFGLRVWPAITVAAFAVNASNGSVPAAAVIAIGNTVAPVLAVVLLSRVDFRPAFERVRDALAIVFLGALASMLLSAAIGTTALVAAGDIPRRDFLEAGSAWWAGDAMGVLIVAPFLWSLRALRSLEFDRIRWDRVLEAAALFGALFAACIVAVESEEQLLFLVLPLLGWIAWRFQQPGAAPAALIASVIVTAAAVDDVGPFENYSLLRQMIILQGFNASVAFTSLLFASSVAERQRYAERDHDRQRDLYQREHRVATTLQRSLLPEHLPETVGLEVATRYLPASSEVAVGGDWYDIIPLGDGRLGLVIGDVAGHGVSAASTMGQLRMALRAYALDDLAPAQALTRLNRLVRELQPATMATVLYAHLDPATRTVRFANAGHLPPLLIRGPHDVLLIEDGRAAPVGVSGHIAFREASLWIDPGATLVLYTDGLVERRRERIDDRLQQLQRVAGEAPGNLEAVCDRLIESMLDAAPADDVALLAVRPVALAGIPLRLRTPALPETVTATRRSVGHWLIQNGVGREQAFEVMIAVTEAYTNAVQHAYGVAEGIVHVDASIEHELLRVTVRDGGTWKPASARHNGCGLMMMRALMTTVTFDTTAHGTEVRMTRDLATRSDHD